MSENVNALSTEDLEGISGGGYEFDRMTPVPPDRKVLVFKKVDGPQTRWDSKLMGDKLRAAGADVSNSLFGQSNRVIIEQLLHDARAKGWDKAPAELKIEIYDSGRVGVMRPILGDYDSSDYGYSGDGYA